MNRPMKRLLAIAASATVGFFGAVILGASPAQAHHPEPGGSVQCQPETGNYEITWTVFNGDFGNHRIMKITDATTDPSGTITGFGVGTMVPYNTTVSGTQTVPGSTTGWVKFTVGGKWYDDEDTTGSGPVLFPSQGSASKYKKVYLDGDCDYMPTPTATFTNNCDGTITVHVSNPGTYGITVKTTGVTPDTQVPAAGTADITVPAGTEGPIVVKWGDKEIGKTDGWTRPQDCPGPSGDGESTCDEFFVKLSNPDGNQPVKATVTHGSTVIEVTVQPGTTEVVELTPNADPVTVDFDDWDQRFSFTYEKPDECDLPETGDNTMGYIGTGAGLIGLGAVVFFLARRRMMQLRRMAS